MVVIRHAMRVPNANPLSPTDLQNLCTVLKPNADDALLKEIHRAVVQHWISNNVPNVVIVRDLVFPATHCPSPGSRCRRADVAWEIATPRTLEWEDYNLVNNSTVDLQAYLENKARRLADDLLHLHATKVTREAGMASFVNLKTLESLGPFAAPAACAIAQCLPKHLSYTDYTDCERTRNVNGVRGDNVFNLRAVRTLRAVGSAAEPYAKVVAELLHKLSEYGKEPLIAAPREQQLIHVITLQTLGELLYRSQAMAAMDFFQGKSLAFHLVGSEIFVSAGFASKNAGHKSVSYLSHFLNHNSYFVRLAAVKALGVIGAAASEHVEQVAIMLSDPNITVSYVAAEALSNMGPLAAAHLAEQLSDTTHGSGFQVVLEDHVINQIEESMKDSSEPAKWRLKVSRFLKDDKKSAVEGPMNQEWSFLEVKVETAQQQKTFLVRKQDVKELADHGHRCFLALTALRTMEDDALLHAPKIIQFVDHPSPSLCVAAIRVLMAMGPEVAEHFNHAGKERFGMLCNHQDKNVRGAATEAIETLFPNDIWASRWVRQSLLYGA
jgi:HEAT repeat protein